MSHEQVADDDMDDEINTERRRMWCLQQAMHVALTYSAQNPGKSTIDILMTAEEMAEFIETGVARTNRVVRTKQ